MIITYGWHGMMRGSGAHYGEGDAVGILLPEEIERVAVPSWEESAKAPENEHAMACASHFRSEFGDAVEISATTLRQANSKRMFLLPWIAGSIPPMSPLGVRIKSLIGEAKERDRTRASDAAMPEFMGLRKISDDILRMYGPFRPEWMKFVVLSRGSSIEQSPYRAREIALLSDTEIRRRDEFLLSAYMHEAQESVAVALDEFGRGSLDALNGSAVIDGVSLSDLSIEQ